MCRPPMQLQSVASAVLSGIHRWLRLDGHRVEDGQDGRWLPAKDVLTELHTWIGVYAKGKTKVLARIQV